MASIGKVLPEKNFALPSNSKLLEAGSLFSRPAITHRKTVGQSRKKNLDLQIKENGFPHLQFAAQDKILRDEDPAAALEFEQGQKKTTVFENLQAQLSISPASFFL
jgi:hypothetical protein